MVEQLFKRATDALLRDGYLDEDTLSEIWMGFHGLLGYLIFIFRRPTVQNLLHNCHDVGVEEALANECIYYRARVDFSSGVERG